MNTDTLAEVTRRVLTRRTHRVRSLPILTLMPHEGCNCRCVMCDIWKANANGVRLGPEELRPQLAAIAALRVRWVVLSGGEALLHPNLWTMCEMLREGGVTRITLLSTGLLLPREAAEVVRWCDEVIVSLDGPPAVHDAIRRVPRAYARLAEGVAAVWEAASGRAPRITARCVVQKANHHDLPGVVAAARALGVDQLSFLAADVTSEAFNRSVPWDADRRSEVALNEAELTTLGGGLAVIVERFRDELDGGFIAESPEKLRGIYHHFAALLDRGSHPQVRCNAPWVSAVIEASGEVRPCFFHPSYGSIGDGRSLDEILNAAPAIAFRRGLDVTRDPICRRCVCSLDLGVRTRIR
jgi:MoaA/NifB/PqqE/SkfB family radical SAM enzyme